jgi:hypothetical protein
MSNNEHASKSGPAGGRIVGDDDVGSRGKKRIYQSPVLVTYGSVRELTAGATGSEADGTTMRMGD